MSRAIHLTSTLTRTYPWLTAPLIISAPMRIMSGPALAVAVSRAGGLGFLGPNTTTQNIATDLAEVSSLLQSPHPPLPGSPTSHLPIGVGFQLWSDDLNTAITTIKQYRPCAVWLFAPANGQSDLDTWSARIRAAVPGTQIWVQIGTVSEATTLLSGREKPDAVVVQGAEAGGHGRANDGMGLMVLLPEIADVLAGSGIMVFGAGGIADGRGAAAALCLGAEGVVMGTRFLAAEEARISKGYQGEVVRVRDGAVMTTRTLLYNHLRGTFGWPQEYSPRTIVNRSWREFQAGRAFEELKRLHDEALKAGDEGWGAEGRLATYAGAAVGLIHEVKDAGTIVREVREQVWERLGGEKGRL
ncbi:nitronate monooxygenase [Aspergillus ibericus CBS 121593]|uniref:Inosine monophosphate dehydrogenase n=1 Tax=Aspergillus ibericus CBS 121593 TaxID=1448316 RepID=A0A395GV55_9EURO|nr:inosine monophosphate dehydrogenase [Aspergillus ibericus CBS 121593]RAK99272.1 inosine monophosphate dehydrogenase [Aspergillus ibericus CBS 121593]